MEKLMDFVRANPARVYAVLAAVAALLPAVIGGVPTVALLGVVAALLGVGEKVQRVENAKTAEAAGPDPELQGH